MMETERRTRDFTCRHELWYTWVHWNKRYMSNTQTCFLYHLCILMIGKLRIWYQLMPLTSGGDGSLHWWPLIVEPMIANGLVKGKTDWWNQELNSLKSRLFQVQVCFLTKILKHQRSNHLPRSHLTWGLNAHDSSEVTSWFRSRSPARSSSVLVKSLALKILVNNKRSFNIAGKWMFRPNNWHHRCQTHPHMNATWWLELELEILDLQTILASSALSCRSLMVFAVLYCNCSQLASANPLLGGSSNFILQQAPAPTHCLLSVFVAMQAATTTTTTTTTCTKLYNNVISIHWLFDNSDGSHASK